MTQVRTMIQLIRGMIFPRVASDMKTSNEFATMADM